MYIEVIMMDVLLLQAYGSVTDMKCQEQYQKNKNKNYKTESLISL